MARKGVVWTEQSYDKVLQRNDVNAVTELSIQLKGTEFLNKLTVCQFAKRLIKITGVPKECLGITQQFPVTRVLNTRFRHI
jgi:hypothetical protein